MWLKVEEFKGLLKKWWEGYSFSGASSFSFAAKFKVKEIQSGIDKSLEKLKSGRVWPLIV